MFYTTDPQLLGVNMSLYTEIVAILSQYFGEINKVFLFCSLLDFTLLIYVSMNF